MRVVIDGRMLEWTGIGRYTRQLLAGLADLDPASEFVVLVPSRAAEGLVPDRANFRTTVVGARPYSAAEQWEVARAARRHRPDLAHFPHFTVPFGYRAPFVVTVHDLTMASYRNVEGAGAWAALRYEVKFRLGRHVLTSALRRARRVITEAGTTADAMAGLGVDRNRLVVTNLGADRIAARPEPVPSVAGRRYVLYVGNCYPHKNLDVLVAALERLGGAFPDVALVLAGSPNYFYERLRARVEAGPARDAVVFAGAVSDGELAWLYDHAAVFAFPSLSEGFGLPGLEAMAHGVPVAASATSCLPEIYGDAARYFDPTDPADVAGALAALLEDADVRSELIDRGHARVAGYSWTRMAEQTLRCYREAVAG